MMTSIQVRDGLTLHHVGPSLEEGPLPSIVYLALCAKDSLTKDPINEPVQFLADQRIRFFSIDLPAHENDRSPYEALASWAHDIEQGTDIFTPFFNQVMESITYGITNNLIDPEQLGIAGLSRGGFLAIHLAALDPRLKAIVLFAPLTNLATSKDLRPIADHPLAKKFNLEALTDTVTNKKIRFYMGNKDSRVDTKSCIDFAWSLMEKSTLRAPQIELIITPSIGQMGHGTSPEMFQQGAKWLAAAIRSKTRGA
jgi:esterase FrsA